jgi:flagellar hook-length control protein FliK
LGQRLWDKVVLTKENSDSFGHKRRQESENQWRQGNFLRNLQSFQEKSTESLRNFQRSSQVLSQKDIQTAINEILQRAKMVQQSKEQFRFSAQLKPEWLGRMRFHIEYDRGQMIGKFFVESESAKEALQQNLQYLKKEFNNMGLEVADFEVAQEQYGRFLESEHNGEAEDQQAHDGPGYNGKDESEDAFNAEGELSDTRAKDSLWEFDLRA